jgi:hypothetical protein
MKSKKTIVLKDYEINVKIKLAALWISVMFCYIYGDYFELYTPDKVTGLLDGTNVLNSPLKLFLASLLMTIPALMTYLSLALKPKLSKWLNIIFGLFFTTIMILIAVTSITIWYSFYVFLAIVEIILTSLIVWKSIKWPKQTTTRSTYNNIL